MRLIIALLIQAVTGVLSGPDPAQMERAPDLGYRAVPAGLTVPEGMKMGASPASPSIRGDTCWCSTAATIR